ncbi:hypothetical protein PR048_015859 [Dryococelus australis]|uniref:Uncharacterized protein n=1 Tax=Dryococelus australis TaxID=614101 RepID=A0ABQ9HJ83_9NEOP|nr:hypothetical protein PR048_015859 [Dryococelus australis]
MACCDAVVTPCCDAQNIGNRPIALYLSSHSVLRLGCPLFTVENDVQRGKPSGVRGRSTSHSGYWLLLRAPSVYSTELAPAYLATLHHTSLVETIVSHIGMGEFHGFCDREQHSTVLILLEPQPFLRWLLIQCVAICSSDLSRHSVLIYLHVCSVMDPLGNEGRGGGGHVPLPTLAPKKFTIVKDVLHDSPKYKYNVSDTTVLGLQTGAESVDIIKRLVRHLSGRIGAEYAQQSASSKGDLDTPVSCFIASTARKAVQSSRRRQPREGASGMLKCARARTHTHTHSEDAVGDHLKLAARVRPSQTGNKAQDAHETNTHLHADGNGGGGGVDASIVQEITFPFSLPGAQPVASPLPLPPYNSPPLTRTGFGAEFKFALLPFHRAFPSPPPHFHPCNVRIDTNDETPRADLAICEWKGDPFGHAQDLVRSSNVWRVLVCEFDSSLVAPVCGNNILDSSTMRVQYRSYENSVFRIGNGKLRIKGSNISNMYRVSIAYFASMGYTPLSVRFHFPYSSYEGPASSLYDRDDVKRRRPPRMTENPARHLLPTSRRTTIFRTALCAGEPRNPLGRFSAVRVIMSRPVMERGGGEASENLADCYFRLSRMLLESWPSSEPTRRDRQLSYSVALLQNLIGLAGTELLITSKLGRKPVSKLEQICRKERRQTRVSKDEKSRGERRRNLRRVLLYEENTYFKRRLLSAFKMSLTLETPFLSTLKMAKNGIFKAMYIKIYTSELYETTQESRIELPTDFPPGLVLSGDGALDARVSVALSLPRFSASDAEIKLYPKYKRTSNTYLVSTFEVKESLVSSVNVFILALETGMFSVDNALRTSRSNKGASLLSCIRTHHMPQEPVDERERGGGWGWWMMKFGWRCVEEKSGELGGGNEHPTRLRALAVTPTKVADCTDQHGRRLRLCCHGWWLWLRTLNTRSCILRPRNHSVDALSNKNCTARDPIPTLRKLQSLVSSHQGEVGSISGGVAPGFLHVGIVPDDIAGRRVFSGISRFPILSFQHCSILTSLPNRLSRPRVKYSLGHKDSTGQGSELISSGIGGSGCILTPYRYRLYVINLRGLAQDRKNCWVTLIDIGCICSTWEMITEASAYPIITPPPGVRVGVRREEREQGKSIQPSVWRWNEVGWWVRGGSRVGNVYLGGCGEGEREQVMSVVLGVCVGSGSAQSCSKSEVGMRLERESMLLLRCTPGYGTLRQMIEVGIEQLEKCNNKVLEESRIVKIIPTALAYCVDTTIPRTGPPRIRLFCPPVVLPTRTNTKFN